MSSFHTPVLLNEAVNGLEVVNGKKYIDATLGAGGHFVEILRRGGKVLGIDQDPDALKYVKENIKSQISNIKEEDWKIVHGNFRNIVRIAHDNGFGRVSGILFDLGVSSFQLDTSKRGFSYRSSDTELDLRFDQGNGESASSILNRKSEEELYEIFSRFGEEKYSRPIAHAIVRTRKVKPIHTTGDVVGVIESVEGTKADRNGTLSRVFQALRIAVNEELESLKSGLSGAEQLLDTNGKLVVISFHSLEDRIVKQFMRGSGWSVETKKPVLPSLIEIHNNYRSRSAKLRIAKKL